MSKFLRVGLSLSMLLGADSPTHSTDPNQQYLQPCKPFSIPDINDHVQALSQLRPVFGVPIDKPEFDTEYLPYGFQIVETKDGEAILTLSIFYHNDEGEKIVYSTNYFSIDSSLLNWLLGEPTDKGHFADSETIKLNLKEIEEGKWMINSADSKIHEDWHHIPGDKLQCYVGKDGEQHPYYVVDASKHSNFSNLNKCNKRFAILTLERCKPEKLVTILPDEANDVGTIENPVNIFLNQSLMEIFPNEDAWSEAFCGGYSNGGNKEECVGDYFWYPNGPNYE